MLLIPQEIIAEDGKVSRYLIFTDCPRGMKFIKITYKTERKTNYRRHIG